MENDNVLEQLEVAFSEAIDEGNIEEARAIIVHVKDIDVFSAKVLEATLLDTPLSKFTIKTPYVL